MSDKRMTPRAGEIYRHFKNNLYQSITVAEHSETGEKLVVYQALYGDFKVFARPLSMFMSEVDRGKYPEAEQEYRFEKVEPEDIRKQEDSIISKKQEEEPEQETLSFEENNPLLEFLDAPDHQSRLDVLMRYKDTVSEIMLDSMSLSMDCVLNGQSREEKYNELEKILKTKVHYEKKPR